MGRKKSVVLTVLLTVVIIALCVLTVFPAFMYSNGVNGWRSAALHWDAGSELRGGYYTYYYPQGVITAADYEDLDADKKADYVQHKGLYLETDEKLEIFDDEHTAESVGGIANVSEEFKAEFARATQAINSRFAKKGFSQYRVAVVDDYALRIEVPAPNRHAEDPSNPEDVNSTSALEKFYNLGALSVKKGTEEIEEFAKAESMKDFIQSFSVEVEQGWVWIVATLTGEGKSVVNGLKDSLDDSNPLSFYVGDTATELQVKKDYITSDTRIKAPITTEANKPQVETVAILLNSALETGGFFFEFQPASHKTIDEGNVMIFVYIALGLALLACLVLPIVFFGKFGIVNLYTALSYLIVTGLFFAFVTAGLFEITLGTLLVFLFGLLLSCAFNAYIYTAIKKEFLSGKTVASAVKKGYGKTLWHVIDTYAVLLLGALAMLIGAGGVFTLALQSIICLVMAAFCNLLWGRAINYVFLSAAKDKYKYFRFAREEEDEDDED